MKLNLNIIFISVTLLVLNSAAVAEDRLVPGVYPTIQAGIDAAVDGDTVIVAQGTYFENIDFGGKSITVTSIDPNEPAATVIDAAGSGTVVTFPDAASANCVLEGFTITHGDTLVNGGGMLCLNGSIEINNCIVSDNSATGNGGGVYTDQANLTFNGCVFSGNSAYGGGGKPGGGNGGGGANLAGGGGIFTRSGGLTLTDCRFNNNTAVNSSGGGIRCTQAELILTGCTFVSNSAVMEGGGVSTDAEPTTVTDCEFSGNSAKYGGGMCNSHRGATVNNCLFVSNSAERGGGISTLDTHSGDLSLNNCTFSGNIADIFGGAFCDEKGGNSTLTNCIFWDNIAYNEGPQIALEENGTTSVSYCCIQGGNPDIYTGFGSTVSWLAGNITADPLFADAASGDLHLKSQGGRWDPAATAWVTDSSNSPCIDAGDPADSNWAEEIWPSGKRVNMGAFGGTAEASKSLSTGGNIADINSSGSVDAVDLNLLAGKWLSTEASLNENLNGDEIVDIEDFAILASNWGWSE